MIKKIRKLVRYQTPFVQYKDRTDEIEKSRNFVREQLETQREARENEFIRYRSYQETGDIK